MHERFRKRLEELERLHKQLSEPSCFLAICFVHPDGSPAEAVIPTNQKDFTCRRGEGEALGDFKMRAVDECRALHPFGPPIGLIFFTEEPSDAARS
jgi:hypothetical protein